MILRINEGMPVFFKYPHTFFISYRMKKRLSFIIAFAIATISGNVTSQKLSLLFAGDAMQHKAQIENARKSDGGFFYDDNFSDIKDEVSSADIAIVNLEAPLGGNPYTGYPTFSAPDEFAGALKRCGFDIFLTANNHILDKGAKGTVRTIAALDSIGVRHTGSYKNSVTRRINTPLMITGKGIRIALLNYTYGTNGITVKAGCIINYIDTALIKRDINAAKDLDADIIIAALHWGDEYQTLPNKKQKALAEWLHKSGVRIIIGSHPHVIQPIVTETDENGNIDNITLYSLGNFISNMQTKMTMGSIIFRFELEKKNDSVIITSPRYAKIFTQRPAQYPGMPFRVIAADSSNICNVNLPKRLRSDIENYATEADKIFRQNNSLDVKEYFYD